MANMTPTPYFRELGDFVTRWYSDSEGEWMLRVWRKSNSYNTIWIKASEVDEFVATLQSIAGERPINGS